MRDRSKNMNFFFLHIKWILYLDSFTIKVLKDKIWKLNCCVLQSNIYLPHNKNFLFVKYSDYLVNGRHSATCQEFKTLGDDFQTLFEGYNKSSKSYLIKHPHIR